jgi:hypothetical protein
MATPTQPRSARQRAGLTNALVAVVGFGLALLCSLLAYWPTESVPSGLLPASEQAATSLDQTQPVELAGR